MKEITAKIWLDDYEKEHLLAKDAFRKNISIATDKLNDTAFGPRDTHCSSPSDHNDRYGAEKFFSQLVRNDELWATVKSERKRLRAQMNSIKESTT